MYTLQANGRLTRRKQLCFILDEHEALLWSGKSVGGAISWLQEAGETKFILEGQEPGERFILTFRPG